jgi:hypothetical protein
MEFHLDQQNKIRVEKRKYLDLVQDLLARGQGKNVYEEFPTDHEHRIEVLEEEEQATTIDLQLSSDHVEDVTQGTSFYVGELEVNVDKHADEGGCTRDFCRLESLYDEYFNSNARDIKLEEHTEMTLQNDEPLQNDNHEMYTLRSQLKVNEDRIVASLVHYDNTHKLVEDIYRKEKREGKGDWPIVDLQVVKIALDSMKSEYLYLLSDRDYILKVVEIHVDWLDKERN